MHTAVHVCHIVELERGGCHGRGRVARTSIESVHAMVSVVADRVAGRRPRSRRANYRTELDCGNSVFRGLRLTLVATAVRRRYFSARRVATADSTLRETRCTHTRERRGASGAERAPRRGAVHCRHARLGGARAQGQGADGAVTFRF